MSPLCAEWNEGDEEPCGEPALSRFDIRAPSFYAERPHPSTKDDKLKDKMVVFKCRKHAMVLHRRLVKQGIRHTETAVKRGANGA